MKIDYPNRRQFITALGCAGTLHFAAPVEGGDHLPALYSVNYQTAIGLGDESATIVDRFGQLKSDDANVPELANAARGGGSRNVNVFLKPGEPARLITSFQASQTLEDGYLPIVQTDVHAQLGPFQSIVFSSDSGNVKADYIGIKAGANPFHVELLCPTTTRITVDDGVVRTPNRILATIPPPAQLKIHNARYNCMTPERNSRAFPSAVAWEGFPRFRCPPSLDLSFSSARTGSTSVDYSFPVTQGKTYRVYVGIGNPAWLVGNTDYFKVLKIAVDQQTQTIDLSRLPSEQPVLADFEVPQAEFSIHVRASGVEGGPLLSGIWIFDAAQDRRSLITGKLNRDALYYARCGRERPGDIISSVDLLYHPSASAGSAIWIQLPYGLHSEDVQLAKTVSFAAAMSTTKARWNSFLDEGTHLETGVTRLDNLYKTSLINLLLIRTKYSGQGAEGRDIYAVKPGATVYDSFWYRDGSYIIAAMDVAGHPDEAERSLRLFTDGGLKDNLKAWGQQPSGLWESPGGEWDSQGQALWALVHHFELTGDLSWLRSVYDNIRKGVLWLRGSMEKTQQSEDHREKPIFWGLLEKGVSEDTGSASPSYIYEHDFWAALGLRKALVASQSLKEDNDTQWIKEAYRQFCGNLLSSVKRAYRDVGRSQFIPADPFDPSLDINGDIAAVYPTGFLDARDPMVKNSLKRIASHSREGLYTWFKTLNNGDMWTYMTADWAMCYLLGDELPMFYELFQAYANHASPTNNWSECIYSESRLGTGDTPHGWAAASFVLLYRNSLVYEHRDNLELCWGVFPEWLRSGAHIRTKNAPTKFGKIDFELRRSESVIDFEYLLIPGANQPRPNEVRLHIPPALRSQISEVRLNGRIRTLSPEESVLPIE